MYQKKEEPQSDCPIRPIIYLTIYQDLVKDNEHNATYQ